MPRRYSVFFIAALAAILAVFIFAAARKQQRGDELAVQQKVVATLCTEVRDIDAVVITQLRGALARLNASVDKTSPLWVQQHRLLERGIKTLSAHTCAPNQPRRIP